MHPGVRAGAIACSVLLLSACVAQPSSMRAPPPSGRVGVDEVEGAPPASGRLALAPNETFQRPLPEVGNALPDYPAELLARRLPPQPVCLQLSIGEDGRVAATSPITVGPDCTATSHAPASFRTAAAAAAGAWRFEPAFRCIHPEPPARGSNGCFGEGVREVPQAISLVYRFVFEQVDGQGAVRLAH